MKLYKSKKCLKSRDESGLPRWLSNKEPSCQCRRCGVRSLGQKHPLEETATYSSIVAGKSHGQRSLVGYSSWGGERVRHDLATNQQRWRSEHDGGRAPSCVTRRVRQRRQRPHHRSDRRWESNLQPTWGPSALQAMAGETVDRCLQV